MVGKDYVVYCIRSDRQAIRLLKALTPPFFPPFIALKPLGPFVVLALGFANAGLHVPLVFIFISGIMKSIAVIVLAGLLCHAFVTADAKSRSRSKSASAEITNKVFFDVSIDGNAAGRDQI